MKLELLKTEDFPIVYKIMEQSFPPFERRPYDKCLNILSNPNYHIYISKSNDRVINGFLSAWEFENFIFIELFAVDKRWRGLKIGSRMMKAFLNTTVKSVVLEVEAFDTALAKRRIKFYKRLNFFLNDFGYYQPTPPKYTNKVLLKLMSYPYPMDKEKLKEIKKEIFNKAYNIKGK